MPNPTNQQSHEFQFAQSVAGIAERIAFQLGDADCDAPYATFDKAWIMARVVDTLKWLQGRRPGYFSIEETFTLQPGASFKRPENCDKLFEISSVSIKGRKLPACETEYKTALAANRLAAQLPTCMHDAPVQHFAFNPNNEDQFVLSPPANGEVKITATCSDVKRFLDDPDLEFNCEAAQYINAIVEYVLFQAQSMDAENPALASMSEQHRATFFDLAPVRSRNTDSNS